MCWDESAEDTTDITVYSVLHLLCGYGRSLEIIHDDLISWQNRDRQTLKQKKSSLSTRKATITGPLKMMKL